MKPTQEDLDHRKEVAKRRREDRIYNLFIRSLKEMDSYNYIMTMLVIINPELSNRSKIQQTANIRNYVIKKISLYGIKQSESLVVLNISTGLMMDIRLKTSVFQQEMRDKAFQYYHLNENKNKSKNGKRTQKEETNGNGENEKAIQDRTNND